MPYEPYRQTMYRYLVLNTPYNRHHYGGMVGLYMIDPPIGAQTRRVTEEEYMLSMGFVMEDDSVPPFTK